MIATLPSPCVMPKKPDESMVPPHAQRKDARLELRLEPVLAERAQRRADRLGLTKSSLARMALIHYLDQMDEADQKRRQE